VALQEGDSISCFVFDVEEGRPLLTQRLPEDGDDELAELAEALEGLQDIEDIPDGLLVQGLWAAEESAVDADDEDAVDGDLMLEEVMPGNVSHCALHKANLLYIYTVAVAPVICFTCLAHEKVQLELPSSWNDDLHATSLPACVGHLLI